MKYKYNEEKSLKELKTYIDSTYDKHYSHNNFQATGRSYKPVNGKCTL